MPGAVAFPFNKNCLFDATNGKRVYEILQLLSLSRFAGPATRAMTSFAQTRRQAKKSVLIRRGTGRHAICSGPFERMRGEFTIRRILFATDFSPICESAFHYATEVATHFKARLYLLHVVPQSAAQRTQARLVSEALSARHEAESQMRRLRDQLLTCHDDYMMAVVSGQPASRIVEKAREMEADLIILGIHDTDNPTAGTSVDVARQVCASSPCPVTCVPLGSRGLRHTVRH